MTWHKVLIEWRLPILTCDEHVQLAALKLALELGDGFITCRHRDASGHLLSSSQGNFNVYLILEHRCSS
ncbi:hypothetical protein P8452_43102 [Trifolium repens]|nr:hypothetical protein P8452_43102 [Trifolium repens]